MYNIDVENTGGTDFMVNTEGHTFVVDTKGKGPSPLAILLSGLGTCIGVYAQRYFEGVKLDVKGFKVNVSAELNKDKPASFKQINVTIDTNGVTLDDERREALLRFVKNCPAHNTLKGNPTIDIEVKK